MKSTSRKERKVSNGLLNGSRSAFDPSLREQMIASAAYFRAEQRGFTLGNELEDWLESEAEIDNSLRTMSP